MGLSILTCLTASLLLLFSSMAFASLSDELVSKLEKADWEDVFYHKGGLNHYKSGNNFRALVEVVENKGLDWPIRIRGIRLLSHTDNAAAPDILIGMLYDPFFNHECPAIKSSVAEALGNFKRDHRVVDALLHSINDEEIHVREASVDSLGRIGNRKAIPVLLNTLNDKSVAIRIAAVRALVKIGDPSVLPALKAIADKDSSEEIRQMARESLIKLHK